MAEVEGGRAGGRVGVMNWAKDTQEGGCHVWILDRQSCRTRCYGLKGQGRWIRRMDLAPWIDIKHERADVTDWGQWIGRLDSVLCMDIGWVS